MRAAKIRKIDKLILHVSDSRDDRNFDVFHVSRWHQGMNFPRSLTGLYCGYHYVITKAGEVQVGRFEHEVGAHCRGHNATSIGICWMGRNDFNKAQREAVIEVLARLCAMYGLETKQIFGHRELNPGKSCPNIKEMDRLRGDVELKIQANLPVLRGA